MKDIIDDNSVIHSILYGLRDVDFQNQSVLITGGSGFLGSWMCETLLAKGAEVICLDNYASGRPENTDHLLNFPEFSRVEHDISKPYDPKKKGRFSMPSCIPGKPS